MIFFKVLFEILIVLSPLVLTLPDESKFFTYPFILEYKENIFTFLLYILPISIIGRYLIEYSLFRYKNENKKLLEAVQAYRSFLSGYIDEKLKSISSTLNFTESERITIFLYSSTLNKFFSIGRYSLSPKYNKIGRYIIDTEKEYVYAVLNDETHYEKSPLINNSWYFSNKYKRTMESKDMYGVPLFDSKSQNKIGVAVIQTMKSKAYTSKTIRRKIAEEVKKLNEEINLMNIDPNSVASSNKTLEGL